MAKRDQLLPEPIVENGHIVMPVAAVLFAGLTSTDSVFMLFVATALCIYLLLGIIGTVVRRGKEAPLWRYVGAGSLILVGISFARASLGIFGFGSGMGTGGGRNTLLFMAAGGMAGLLALAMTGVGLALAIKPDSLGNLD